jgi:hypothetical protein
LTDNVIFVDVSKIEPTGCEYQNPEGGNSTLYFQNNNKIVKNCWSSNLPRRKGLSRHGLKKKTKNLNSTEKILLPRNETNSKSRKRILDAVEARLLFARFYQTWKHGACAISRDRKNTPIFEDSRHENNIRIIICYYRCGQWIEREKPVVVNEIGDGFETALDNERWKRIQTREVT